MELTDFAGGTEGREHCGHCFPSEEVGEKKTRVGGREKGCEIRILRERKGTFRDAALGGRALAIKLGQKCSDQSVGTRDS